ncbi:MAG: phosphoenolpyruvate carboxykinase (GTP) [Planctomycetes bacterium]|nr:phosphoenolpyruvate carboxykinase (GTP) [Planctomycetota bacterium]
MTKPSSPAPTTNKALLDWVESVRQLCQPARLHWCDGSQAEYDGLIKEMLGTGLMTALDQGKWPGCYHHRSNVNDVARVEHLTYICSRNKDDAGPNNNWLAPDEARAKLTPWFSGCMQGRTMYVIPYCMGPVASPYSKVGFEITDSPYVVVNMHIMTRAGAQALKKLGDSTDFVRGVHSTGELSPDKRAICHFPETREIWSYGSGYGGNALLGKKCHALRIASVQARDEGWLAEHMLILGLENPKGETRYVAAAFPSACGKTNLAMLVPPAHFKGWKIWTVGDDICWMRYGPDGRLWAINPEAGFFGVAPGTGEKTNPNALASLRKNSIFTNTAVTADNQPWWEGLGPAPAKATDWKGQPWTPDSKEKAAHPNSRFTAPARQCPSVSPKFDDPQGVPISAIIFGGRRARTAPLVFETFDWKHGTYVGAMVASETTAAATGAVGVVRRDPMAMLPFCGYNMADYFGHWMKVGAKSDKAPRIFHVNWFRQDKDGKFLWPGFGDNMRVLKWVLDRVDGKAKGSKTPIGYVPAPGELDLAELDIKPEVVEELLDVDAEAWQAELAGQKEWLEKFGAKMPKEMWDQYKGLEQRLTVGAR